MKSSRVQQADFVGGHRIITWAAMECLPKWQREIWASELYDLANVYSLYGDTYWTNREELGPFVELPDGKAPQCEIGQLRFKHHYGQADDYWESPFYDKCEEVLTYYMRRIGENIAAGNIHHAARFAGSAAHYLEDSGVPAHSVDNGDLEFVKDYFPPPPGMGCFPLHSYTEKSPGMFSIKGYRPRLYGLTPEEAAANFVHRYVEQTVFARSLLFPLTRCGFEGNDKKAGELRLEAAKLCAKVYADYMFTATCVSVKRFEKEQTENLARIHLIHHLLN